MSLVVGGKPTRQTIPKGVDPPRFSVSVQRIRRTYEPKRNMHLKGVGQLRRDDGARARKCAATWSDSGSEKQQNDY